MDDQKEVYLVRHSIYFRIAKRVQFFFLGAVTASDINNWFWHEKHHLNNNYDVHLELKFNKKLSHLIYAGADMIVVTSNYEPCRLTQIISLRYGTIPIVRGVGGLINTVFDRNYDQFHHAEERNGYVFFQADFNGLESALHRPLELW
ncbi:glycogen synthase [cyanobacterium endosymbiont of Epithemia clementina EcSB]|uniref:hypothetical protein n=1 Tax=cyanobacterium endosymbiont of Epithemia clementina EcSB TaxID=3034674 RepID=UPI003863440E